MGKLSGQDVEDTRRERLRQMVEHRGGVIAGAGEQNGARRRRRICRAVLHKQRYRDNDQCATQ